MALSRVVANHGEGEMSSAAAQAGEIFNPMIRFGSDDVKAWVSHGFAISERGELNTGPTELFTRKTRFLKLLTHHVIGSFFAAVFQKKRRSNVWMSKIPAERTAEQTEQCFAGGAAPFGMGQCFKARNSLGTAEL